MHFFFFFFFYSYRVSGFVPVRNKGEAATKMLMLFLDSQNPFYSRAPLY